MLIEIDKSVVDKADLGDAISLRVLQVLSTAQAYGYHIVWASRKTLKEIVKLKKLSYHDVVIYKSILNKYSTATSEYLKIKFKTIVTYVQHTSRQSNLIIINPQDTPQFNFVVRTNVLTENILDSEFFFYIGNYTKRIQGFSNLISIDYKKEPGGGDTTAQKYEDFSKNGEEFCLCILDGDIKYKGCPYGDTYKKVAKVDKNIGASNCIYYGTSEVREVENLIPQHLYLNDSNYSNFQIVKDTLGFDMSFFDLKDGLKSRNISKADISIYWKLVLHAYSYITCYIDCVDEIRTLTNNDSKYFKSVCGEDVIIEGFGSKLLDWVLKNKASELDSVNVTNLTVSQIKEWNTIGELILNWCCCTKVPKVAFK